jgi:single-strand DNA-binding protein
MTLPRIEATGRLGNDPELKFTPSGSAVANFSIACDENKKGDNGQWEKLSTTWLRVAVWKEAAEAVAEHLKKGDLVTVIGQLTVRDYEHNGVAKQSVEVKNATVTKALPRQANGAQSSGSGGWQPSQPSPQSNTPADPWSTQPALEEPPF